MQMPGYGDDAVMAFRNIEKIIWYTQKISEEFLSRGFTLEVRQYSNELIVVSEIWGLQIPYLYGKSNQVRALHFEGQKSKWQEEVKVLADSLDTNNGYMRQLNPGAIAEAISLEPIRRNSSIVSQTQDSILPISTVPMINVLTPGKSKTENIDQDILGEKLKKSNIIQIPKLPKAWFLDAYN